MHYFKFLKIGGAYAKALHYIKTAQKSREWPAYAERRHLRHIKARRFCSYRNAVVQKTASVVQKCTGRALAFS